MDVLVWTERIVIVAGTIGVVAVAGKKVVDFLSASLTAYKTGQDIRRAKKQEREENSPIYKPTTDEIVKYSKKTPETGDLVEYSLVLGLVAVALVAMLPTVAETVESIFRAVDAVVNRNIR